MVAAEHPTRGATVQQRARRNEYSARVLLRVMSMLSEGADSR